MSSKAVALLVLIHCLNIPPIVCWGSVFGPCHMKHYLESVLIGPRREITCLQGVSNNTSADQHAHPRSLISAFVVRLMKSIISRLASSEISIL